MNTANKLRAMQMTRKAVTPDTAPLVDKLTNVLACTFYLYYKAHAIHWNVIGPLFYQYHDFFGHVYENIHSSVDAIAEHVRALGAFAPANLNTLSRYHTDSVEMRESDSIASMIMQFSTENQKLIALLREAIETADTSGEPAVSNFLQDRLDYHQKLQWMITALQG